MTNGPQYKHPCSQCVFIGKAELGAYVADVYICEGAQVVARVSSELGAESFGHLTDSGVSNALAEQLLQKAGIRKPPELKGKQ